MFSGVFNWDLWALTQGPGAQTTGAASNRPVVVVLLDSTPSTLETRTDYLEDLGSIVETCAAEECLLLLVGMSESSSTGAFQAFDFLSSGASSFERNQISISQAERVAVQARSMLNSSGLGNCSDLIGAFNEAGKVIQAYHGQQSRIVAFTDGLSNCSPDIVETAKGDWSELRGLLAELNIEGRVPEFEGATVWMSGFGLRRSSRPPLDPSSLENLERFWAVFIEDAGGRVAPGGIAARLYGYPSGL